MERTMTKPKKLHTPGDPNTKTKKVGTGVFLEGYYYVPSQKVVGSLGYHMPFFCCGQRSSPSVSSLPIFFPPGEATPSAVGGSSWRALRRAGPTGEQRSRFFCGRSWVFGEKWKGRSLSTKE